MQVSSCLSKLIIHIVATIVKFASLMSGEYVSSYVPLQVLSITRAGLCVPLYARTFMQVRHRLPPLHFRRVTYSHHPFL